MQMTQEQLGDHIKAVVLPMIEDKVGHAVKEVVANNMEKSLEASGKAFMSPFVSAMSQFAPKAEVKPMEKGLKFGRFVRACIHAKVEGLGHRGVPTILKEWKNEEMISEYETYQKALAATDATAGGFLVPPQYSSDIIELLRAKSVIRMAGPTTIPMSTGTFRIPKITEGSHAYYIGENQPIPKSQPSFGQLTLTFKKLAALVPISNDLLRYSSPSADAIVRDDMVREMADAENDALLRGTGTGGEPRGLLNWALPANTLNANATSNMDNFVTDMGRMIIKLLEANIPMTRPCWIWAPRQTMFASTLNTSGIFPFRDEVLRGQFWGYPIYVSTAIPTNLNTLGRASESEIYLVDMADVVLGESLNLVIDSSNEAAYVEGSTVVSAFQNDQTVIRTISEHDLVMRRQESLAVLQGTVYGK
jgi:HK97 family phage major capsid protein